MIDPNVGEVLHRDGHRGARSGARNVEHDHGTKETQRAAVAVNGDVRSGTVARFDRARYSGRRARHRGIARLRLSGREFRRERRFDDTVRERTSCQLAPPMQTTGGRETLRGRVANIDSFSAREHRYRRV